MKKWENEKGTHHVVRGISGFLRKVGREVPLFLENMNTGKHKDIAQHRFLKLL